MDVDMDSSHTESERAEGDSNIQAPCSSNGSGGEEDEAEAIRGVTQVGDSVSRHMPNEGGILGREQEVSVEIGETYLCQRTDKTWRKQPPLFSLTPISVCSS